MTTQDEQGERLLADGRCEEKPAAKTRLEQLACLSRPFRHGTDGLGTAIMSAAITSNRHLLMLLNTKIRRVPQLRALQRQELSNLRDRLIHGCHSDHSGR